MTTETHSTRLDQAARLPQYPLLDALITRRSRRFAKGLRLNGGPLAYTSTQMPQPLSVNLDTAFYDTFYQERR